MKADYNTILDYILSETIKRKNEHPTNTFRKTEYKAIRIIPTKEIEDKFGIEDFEVEIMYYELTNNSYLNSYTGNVTLKGIEFSDSGGFTGKQRREINANRVNLLQQYLLILGSVSAFLLVLFEIWKVYHHLTWE